MSVAAAILAAGLGSRLGGDVPKPLVELRGRPLVTWALETVMATDLRPVVLVVGWRGEGVEGAAPPGVTVVHARSWHQGIAHSLHAAIEALEGFVQVDAVCVGLADQPRVGPDAYRRLAAAHESGAELAVATYGGTRGNPVLVGRSLWAEARALRGDVGARALMADHDVVEVDCTDTGDARDVDTLEDLRALDKEMGGT